MPPISIIPYGSMYVDSANITVSMGMANAFSSIGSGLSGGTCSGFTFQNARELKAAYAGKYLVTYSASIGIFSAALSYTMGAAVMINGAAQLNTASSMPDLKTTGYPTYCVAGAGIITLAVNDLVTLAVKEVEGTYDMKVAQVNLAIVRVGN